MDAERWQQIENLYHSALEHDQTRRDGFLADACRGDADLRREVESLLAQSGPTESLVDQTAWAAASELASTHTIVKRGGRLGPYEILGLLGSGGMGEVYSAIDTRLGRKVAIKISHEEFSGRFEREARAISALNHPNICTLHDVGPNYLVMELVEGEPLRDLLKRAPPVERSLEIAKQVLDALRAAHHAGVVHRDLKPQNIMVRFDGYVKVLDFGIAKRMPVAALQTDGTATADASLPGQLLGTVAYMSPEQILGEEVDQRSDLFALGIILYEMLAGRHPWPRNCAVDTLHAVLHEDASPIDGISPNLAHIVQRLLQKNPADRFPSAEAVREALAESIVAPGWPATVEHVAEPLTSIAVLPFLFLSEIDDRKAFSLGFADALITTLSGLEDITVLPTSMVVNCVPGIDPAQSCLDLGVRHLLQGSIQKQGAHWRVSTQLFDSKTQKIAYAEKHDFVRDNVFEVQDEIGRRVVESLQSRLPRATPKSRDRYSNDPEAYADFMSGLRESYGDSPEEFQSAAEHLSKAIERDPEFALAHAWLSHVCMQMNQYFDGRRTWLEKAERHCQRALTLDPDLPEGHWARAAILWSPAKNFQHADAIAALERVLRARPNFDRAHNRMAAICLHIGRFQEARTADQYARRSNPKHSTYNRAWIDLFSGDFSRAREAGEDWFRKSPGNRNALWFSAHALLLAGDPDAAEQRLAIGLDKYREDPLFISLEGMLDARRHHINAALECVRKALDLPSFGVHAHHIYQHVACTYAILGEAEKAMAWLEKSVDTGYPCWPFFRIDPYLENLRREPRFQHLVTALEREFSALKIERL